MTIYTVGIISKYELCYNLSQKLRYMYVICIQFNIKVTGQQCHFEIKLHVNDTHITLFLREYYVSCHVQHLSNYVSQ